MSMPLKSKKARHGLIIHHKNLLTLSTAGFVLGAMLPQFAPAQADDVSDIEIEEVVVTATRRSASINKIPMSLDAYSESEMEAKGIKSIDDVANFTPGVYFAPANDLVSGISIRGVSSGVGASTTGIYIDETPIQVRAGTGVVTQTAYPQIFDLERVEVLRGPQGTLFGTGSMGGTIRFITPEPDLNEYSGQVKSEISTTEGGEMSYEAGAAVGGPIIEEKLGFRASMLYRKSGGYIDRAPFTGTDVTEEDINGEETLVFRGALKLAVTDNLTITPSILYQDRSSDGTNYFWSDLSDTDSANFVTGHTQAEPTDDKYALSALKIEWDLGGAELIANTSYFDRTLDRSSDYSNFNWAALVGDPTPRDPVSDYRVASLAGVEQKDFTQELRLQSTNEDSRFQWVIGAVYQRSKLYTYQDVVDPLLPELTEQVYGCSIEAADCFGDGLIDGVYSVIIDQTAIDKQAAIFGELEYAFLDNLKMTVGLRYAHTKLDFQREVSGPLLCKTCNGLPEPLYGSPPTEKPFTPKISLAWEPSDGTMLYATAGKGYRVGGVNFASPNPGTPGCPVGIEAPDTYKSDNLWSYEVGGNTRLADGRVKLKGSAFYIDWSDVQQYVTNTGCITSAYKDNLGSVKIKGFDFAIAVQPIADLLLEASGSYTDAQYGETAYGAPEGGTGAATVIANDGNSLGISPWNLQLSGQYDFALAGNNAYVRLDYTYTSRDQGNTPDRDPITTSYDPDNIANPAITLLSARLGATIGAFDVSVYGTNLLQNTPEMGRFHDDVGNPLFYATTVRPRTIGLSAAYHF
ncbi:TonB-dependent receptor [Kordiimonas pumila]|uniref:TonB-dependent receptor n=1 Tax=Kordiimonas pumila TaxID=2161677 RepID=A0ABV7D5A0_9PROT|nr:TonB-dependent receptor [Kordiimonas pumila]